MQVEADRIAMHQKVKAVLAQPKNEFMKVKKKTARKA
jgi:hypothetical protein